MCQIARKRKNSRSALMNIYVFKSRFGFWICWCWQQAGDFDIMWSCLMCLKSCAKYEPHVMFGTSGSEQRTFLNQVHVKFLNRYVCNLSTILARFFKGFIRCPVDFGVMNRMCVKQLDLFCFFHRRILLERLLSLNFTQIYLGSMRTSNIDM